MKNLLGVVFLVAIAGLLSCGSRPAGSAPSEVWRGSITERGKSVPVELELREADGALEGDFKILGETGTDDIAQGMAFEIVQAERIGDRCKFIVPLTGEVDDDVIAFDLIVKGGTMTGLAKELRPGSEEIPITFTKR